MPCWPCIARMSSPVVPPPLATISAVSPRPVPSVAFASAPRTSSASAIAGWPRSQARYSRSLPCTLRTAPTGALCTSATAHSVAPLDTAAATPVSHASTASSSSSQPSPPISDARCSRMRSLLRRRRRRARSVSRRSRSAIDIASRNTRARNGLGLWRRTNPEMAKLAPQAKHSPGTTRNWQEKDGHRLATRSASTYSPCTARPRRAPGRLVGRGRTPREAGRDRHRVSEHSPHQNLDDADGALTRKKNAAELSVSSPV